MNIAQDIYRKLQQMPLEQAKTVQAFVDFLQQTNNVPTSSEDNISRYAGMIKLPKTNDTRSLLDFNPADTLADEEENASR